MLGLAVWFALLALAENVEFDFVNRRQFVNFSRYVNEVVNIIQIFFQLGFSPIVSFF